MKAHQSHDVLLLCPSCHEVSNRQDLELRRKLADLCEAPLTRTTAQNQDRTKERSVDMSTLSQSQDPREWRNFLSVVKALRDSPAMIPPRRRKQLEANILKFTGQSVMKPELPDILYEQFKNQPRVVASASPLQTRCQSHGVKVRPNILTT